MREIKFRLWNIKEKKYEYPDTRTNSLFIANDGIFDVGAACADGDVWLDTENVSKNYIVEQFTGLVDKNGVEIFEGDILRSPYNGKLTIIYNSACASFQMLDENQYSEGFLQSIDYRWCEVIGNIHDAGGFVDDQL